jgi:hypothetical protein
MESIQLPIENLISQNDGVLSPDEVAITGSPNYVTEISFDVRITHLQTPLLGALLSLNVPVSLNQEITYLFVLGQVATLETKNRWHEDQSLKNFLKIRGKIPHLTQIGDITLGKLQIIGAYKVEKDGNYKKMMLPVPPGSGLAIGRVDGSVIRRIMSIDFGYGFLGNFYGTIDVPSPVYVRHFGDFKEKGSGEGYMGGVFGPSGSGKSVIAASLIGLWASNPQMGILILDPASEFSNNSFARGSQFQFNFHEILTKFSKNRFNPKDHVIRLDQLQLEGFDMFARVLQEKNFFKILGLSSAKTDECIELVERMLEGLAETNIWNTSMNWERINQLTFSDPAFQRRGNGNNNQPLISFTDLFIRTSANAYASSGRAKKIEEFGSVWDLSFDELQKIWDDTVLLFRPTDKQGKKRILLKEVLESTLSNGAIRILNLNPQTINMSQQFKIYLMDFVFRKLRYMSHLFYAQDKTGNCLIVLDEAGRYIPQNSENDDHLKSLSKTLSDSVKELRKMRCGFMFITQTISEIQKDIFRNLHYRVYGVGLAVGADAEHIRSREGESAFEIYKALPDPRLSGTFSFMIAGVLLALGSTGRPMIIEGYSSGEELIRQNQFLLGTNNRR